MCTTRRVNEHINVANSFCTVCGVLQRARQHSVLCIRLYTFIRFAIFFSLHIFYRWLRRARERKKLHQFHWINMPMRNQHQWYE